MQAAKAGVAWLVTLALAKMEISSSLMIPLIV